MSNAQQEKDFSVCSRLREERKALGLDQQQVADVLVVSLKTVGRWEKSIAIPSDKLAALAAIGVDVVYVLTGQRALSGAKELSDQESAVIDSFRCLSEADQAAVSRLTNALAATSQGEKN